MTRVQDAAHRVVAIVWAAAEENPSGFDRSGRAVAEVLKEFEAEVRNETIRNISAALIAEEVSNG